MMDMFESLVAIYKDYSGSSVYMLLALIAIIYLWLTEQEKTETRQSPIFINLYRGSKYINLYKSDCYITFCSILWYSNYNIWRYTT